MPPGDMAPVLIMAALCLVGIVGILVKHQQKMAMILHGRNDWVKAKEEETKALALTLYGPKAVEQMTGSNLDARLENLERQMLELKDLVHQQTLMIDSISHPTGAVQEIRERLDR